MRAEFPFSGRVGVRASLLRGIIFALVCLFSAAGTVAYVLHSQERRALREATGVEAVPRAQTGLDTVRRQPHLLFRNTAMGPSYGRLAVVGLDALDGPRYVTELSCERVYGSRDTAFCLEASRGVFTTYRAVYFDRNLKPLHTFDLPGTPSRTRVSRDGRMAASTVFVKGDSYNSGGFSTRTWIFDLPAAKKAADLEDFAVTKEGKPFRKVDFNFWGVTFAPDGDRFYATLGSGGSTYLVEGRVSERHVNIVRDGVECPSVSPDGRRVAFKSRTNAGSRMMWNLAVLDLETGSETIITKDQNVDDQAEWLDSEHVLYGMPRHTAGSATWDIWIAPAGGTGSSHVFLTDAASPCVIQP